MFSSSQPVRNLYSWMFTHLSLSCDFTASCSGAHRRRPSCWKQLRKNDASIHDDCIKASASTSCTCCSTRCSSTTPFISFLTEATARRTPTRASGMAWWPSLWTPHLSTTPNRAAHKQRVCLTVHLCWHEEWQEDFQHGWVSFVLHTCQSKEIRVHAVIRELQGKL